MGTKSSYTNDILAGSGNLFIFRNANCETRIDTTHDKAGNEIKTLRIRNTQNVQTFNYKAVEGLYHTTGSGNNLLAELFSLPLDRVEPLNSYFEKYGFFIPISSESFETFSYHDLYSIIARIHALLNLIQELQKKTPDCNRLFRQTTRLQFTNPITISNEAGYTYKTCTHFLRAKIESVNLNELHTPPQYMVEEEYGMPYAHVPDSMSPTGFTDISIDEFMDEYEPSRLSPYLRNLLASCFDCDHAHRRMIELYCHIENSSIMTLKGNNFDILTKLQFSDQTDLNQETKYPDLKDRIIEAAKTTIKDELEYALRNIKPSYDSDTALGSWNIPDFLSALYFSIFYMRPDLQIFRLCASPYCNNYFTVTSTNSRKKYCCHECANYVSQRAYRSRKQQSNNKPE